MKTKVMPYKYTVIKTAKMDHYGNVDSSLEIKEPGKFSVEVFSLLQLLWLIESNSSLW